MTDAKRISRRQALARIGLTGMAAYVAPAVVGMSQARAATAPSEPSTPTQPSPASAPTGATVPTGATGPTLPSGPETGTDQPSGPSGPGACRVPQPDGPAHISRQEYQRAQRAILRGDARPLRDVLDEVLQVHPGRLVQVGYSDSGATPLYRLQIVKVSGVMLTIGVSASTGQIMTVRNC